MKDLSHRLLCFATTCFKLAGIMDRSAAGKYLANQLMRSSASAGADYQEACATESRVDFIHKLHIVLKGLRESDYWVKLLRQSMLIPDSGSTQLLAEVEELIRILAKSMITTKTRGKMILISGI